MIITGVGAVAPTPATPFYARVLCCHTDPAQIPRDSYMHKILLIDDDQKLADLLNRYFGQHDLLLSHAAAPSQGFELLESGEFALIILDIMLPEMDGFEVCRRLRQTRQIPILMLTARGEANSILGRAGL